MSKKYWVMGKARRMGPYTVGQMRESGKVYRDTQIMPQGMAGLFAGPKPVQAYVEFDQPFPIRPTVWSPRSEPEDVRQEVHGAGDVSFETSTQLRTAHPATVILDALEGQFANASAGVKRTEDDTLVIRVIDPTFGSINRADITHIQLRPMDGGFLIVASTQYAPSAAFWFLIFILIFTALGWLLPIAFYLMQKQAVQSRIERVFSRIKDEFSELVPASVVRPAVPDSASPHGEELATLELLEKLGQLRENGVLTREEFDAKKKQILNG